MSDIFRQQIPSGASAELQDLIAKNNAALDGLREAMHAIAKAQAQHDLLYAEYLEAKRNRKFARAKQIKAVLAKVRKEFKKLGL